MIEPSKPPWHAFASMYQWTQLPRERETARSVAHADTKPGKSVCNGPCVAIWPAFSAPAEAKAAGDWSIATRDDGSRQWAYKGKPLYLFARDAKPGDKTGDGFNSNIWHVARP